LKAALTFSVMITTRNRAADLQRTLRVLRGLNPAPMEILITADGCTDETIQMMKAEIEKAESGKRKAESGNLKLIVNEVGKGSVASRDRMMREAKGDLVLALDDDSYPEQSDCLQLLSSIFDLRPSLAVATFPQRTDEYPATLTQTDFGPEHLTRSFPNSGAVLRRSTYLELPGFEPKFFHMYEEPDYALQCVAAGFEVLFTPVVTIRHHYSGAARSELRNHQRHSRNECWSAVMRCPLPQMPLLVLYRVGSQFRYACKRGLGWVVREPIWWWQALKGIPSCLRKRKPVTWAGYKIWLALK
jgi:GT2 family glycosyltransferase